MILRVGNIWDAAGPDNALVVTSNGTVSKQGLVLGAGLARELCLRFPHSPKLAQELIKGRAGTKYNYYHLLQLGATDTGYAPWHSVWLFQVKDDWRSDASVNLISHATRLLIDVASRHNDIIFNLNYPGIGCGRRSKDDVLSKIRYLPNNVVVWEKKLSGA